MNISKEKAERIVKNAKEIVEEQRLAASNYLYGNEHYQFYFDGIKEVERGNARMENGFNMIGKIHSIQDNNGVYIMLADEEGKLVFLMDENYNTIFEDCFVFLNKPDKVATLDAKYKSLVEKRNKNLQILKELQDADETKV